MTLYYPFALVLGIVASFLAFTGCLFSHRAMVLTGMILAAAVASPITTFTRGAAGAVFPSDLVAMTLIACLLLPGTRAMLSSAVPSWYRSFRAMMIWGAISVFLVAPLFTHDLTTSGFGQHVRAPALGIPLPLLIAGFRLVQILLHLAYFAFAARLLMDGRTVRFATRLTALTIAGLAVCQIIAYAGIADLSFYLPGVEHARGYLFGHAKSAIGRLYLAGVFVTIALLYRSLGSPAYIAAFLALVAGIFFAGARAPLVGLVAGLVVMGAGTRIGGKLIVSSLIVVVFVTVAYLAASDPAKAERFLEIVREPSEASRWRIWSWIIGYLFLHPYVLISGVGFTNFKYALITEEVAIAEHAHNDFLTCATELGLVGLALLIMYLYRLGRDIHQRYKTTTGLERWHGLCLGAALAGLIVSGLFEHSFYYSPGAICMQRIFAVLFGVHTAYWVQARHYAMPEQNTSAAGRPGTLRP